MIESTSTTTTTALYNTLEYITSKDVVLLDLRESLSCENINCKDNRYTTLNNSVKCPEDSFEVETDSLERQCCGLNYACECLECSISTMEYEKCTLLGDTFEIIVAKEGDRIPGNCCDSLICSSKNYSCEYQGAFYYHNQKWKEDECLSCTCEFGTVKCVNSIECKNEQCDIKKMDNCCQVCTGQCISMDGNLRFNNESWTESDDCIKCTCVNGIKECLSELCEHPICDNPVKIQGECCLKCPNDNKLDALPLEFPPHCNIFQFKCNLTCSNGLKLDNNRCPLCECSLTEIEPCHFSCEKQKFKYYPLDDRICKCNTYCPEIQKCSILCPYGYVKDSYGCNKCECESNELISNAGNCFHYNNQEYCQLIEYNSTLNSSKKSNICKTNMQSPIKLDKCTECFCKNESFYCEINQYPQYFICKNIIYDENFCPKCSNETDIKSVITKEADESNSSSSSSPSTLSLNLWSCIDIDNKLLRSHGAIWKYNNCLQCKCNNGFRECFKQICLRNYTNCKNLFIMKNSCCPVCLDNLIYVEHLGTISSSINSSNLNLPNLIRV